MKTFTYMAAMENGVYDGSETYQSGVYVTKDGTEIGDWNREGWGTITFDKGYAMSSNTGIINLINRHMDSMMLRQYFKKLGFGKKTGINLPNESTGKIDFKYETEIFNAGFGQGITTTPVQMVQAMTSLTNDGVLLKPYIVSKIVDPETKEVILENKKNTGERVASSLTVKKMIQLMDDCVNGTGNTGSGFRIDSGELIGKTGTSQIAKEDGTGYYTGKYDVISSFAGIYPKSDPEYIIYAAVKRPSNRYK
jgi:penicillin-binding protein 2B